MSSPATSTPTTFPTAFVSHGAGPAVFIEGMDEDSPFGEFGPEGTAHKQLRDVPNVIAKSIGGSSSSSSSARPTAIVVVTAHWETSETIRVSGRDVNNDLLYDYGGFPPNTYRLQYRAPGNSALAKRIVERFITDGHDAQLDVKRNWDHGVFIPLKVMYPEADIPVVAVSILTSHDPAKHVAIGRSLRWLRNEGVLVIGSGSSTHKFPPFPANLIGPIQKFADALDRISIDKTGEEREQAIMRWSQLEGARVAHPRPDHLMPLLVIIGAAGESRGVAAGRFGGMGGGFDVAHYVFSGL